MRFTSVKPFWHQKRLDGPALAALGSCEPSHGPLDLEGRGRAVPSSRPRLERWSSIARLETVCSYVSARRRRYGRSHYVAMALKSIYAISVKAYNK